MDDSALCLFSHNIENAWNWRKKQLIEHKQLFLNLDEYQEGLVARMGVLLLYAHWEGFIKDSSRLYLRYFKGKSIYKVPKHVIAAHLSVSINKISNTHQKEVRPFEIMDCLKNDQNISNLIENSINTESNLNSKVLRNISKLVGINYDSIFSSKDKLIDYSFLGLRHKIAHGEGNPVEKNEYLTLHNEIIPLIEAFKENLIDSAISANDFFKREEFHLCLKFSESH